MRPGLPAYRNAMFSPNRIESSVAKKRLPKSDKEDPHLQWGENPTYLCWMWASCRIESNSASGRGASYPVGIWESNCREKLELHGQETRPNRGHTAPLPATWTSPSSSPRGRGPPSSVATDLEASASGMARRCFSTPHQHRSWSAGRRRCFRSDKWEREAASSPSNLRRGREEAQWVRDEAAARRRRKGWLGELIGMAVPSGGDMIQSLASPGASASLHSGMRPFDAFPRSQATSPLLHCVSLA